MEKWKQLYYNRVYIGFIVLNIELFWGLYRDNGKENANYYSILGLSGTVLLVENRETEAIRLQVQG